MGVVGCAVSSPFVVGEEEAVGSPPAALSARSGRCREILERCRLEERRDGSLLLVHVLRDCYY